MANRFLHFTNFFKARIILCALFILGILFVQTIALDVYRPFTFLQNSIPKYFEVIKSYSITWPVDTLSILKTEITNDLCSNLKISYQSNLITSSVVNQFDYKIAFKDDGDELFNGLLNPNQVYFQMKCTDNKTKKFYGDLDYTLFDEIDLNRSLCLENHTDMLSGQTGQKSICLVSYDQTSLDKSNIPFLSTAIKSTVKDNVKVVKRKFRERKAFSTDYIYIFSDNSGSNYEFLTKNENSLTRQSNLQIDLK
ncbi:MAG: hypothetical protein H7196_04600 [candidate division SR1 bacterium]|nr:hypothetical protein [candidate division SR1 bacterium]